MRNYVSVFDRIDAFDPNGQRYAIENTNYTLGEIFQKNVSLQKFSGTFKRLLFELESIPCWQAESLSDLFKVALHPPRAINAAVDNKIKKPSKATEALVVEAIEYGLQIYRDLGSDVVREFAQEVEALDPQLMHAKVVQKPSEADALAMASFRSKGTAEYIATRADGSNILFIAIAHGGVPTGMDVYLRYRDIANSKGSKFYVARLSTRKLGDKEPQLTKSEMDYLRERAEGKHLVIFDGDRYTGNTLKIADEFFSHTLPFKGKTITGNYSVETGHRFYNV